MTKELSALFDGELEVHEEPALWIAVKADPRHREAWQNYRLIGDAIRREGNLSCDLTGGVMRELDDEPVVLAPRRKQGIRWSNALMAVAASVTGVAVVGWLALTQQLQSGETATLAQASRPAASVAASPAPSQGMQEYMLAHQANAPGLHLQGGAQHIRTVSAVGGGQ
jgi:sigma-E factor negative regulatory protein RseA